MSNTAGALAFQPPEAISAGWKQHNHCNDVLGGGKILLVVRH